MDDLQEYIVVLKALADRSRARILKLLEEHELCVCQIREVLDLRQSTVSKHLSILRKAGLVEDRRDGTWAFYALSRKRRSDFDQALLGLMRNWLNDDPVMQTDRTRLEEVLKIDVRDLCVR